MGVLQAGLLNQPSAQVIDGSLKFDSGKEQYLQQTFGANGNKRTFTYSFWAKKTLQSQSGGIIFVGTNTVTGNMFEFRDAADKLRVHSYQSNSTVDYRTTAEYRDTNGWKHFVVSIDSTNSVASERMKLYINGERVTSFSTTTGTWGDNIEYLVNTSGQNHYIGLLINSSGVNSTWFDGNMTQWYFIDGLALGPGYFGFTDPLTGTWRPKKFRAEGTTVNDGTQWSSYMSNSSGAGNLFDGDTSTAYGPDGNTQTFTPPNPIIVKNSLRIYYSSGSTSRNFEVNDNGNIVATGTGTKWVDLNFTGPLTKISGSNGWNVYAIEVDGVIMVDSTTQNLDFGTNGFYLPMDGNSPIGQDKSGKGNNWTPVNFGGSAGVDQATGALPILEGAGGAVANVGVRTDAYASNLFLALPLVGNTNDVSNQINSGSTTKIGTNSSVTPSSTQSNFYGGSHHWNSNTDSLLYAQQGNDLVFGTGDFTIEFWFYDDNGHNGNNNRCVLFDNRRGGNVQGDPPQLVGWVDSHNEINLYYANGSEINITVPSTVGKWWHYAAVRSSGTTKLYIDGVEVGSASDTTNYPNNGIALGSGTDSGYSWSGYIQDFRVYKTAKYTENFIPASTSPDVLPDTPSGVSGSSKLTISPDTSTEGAVVFDGNSDYLSSTGPGTLAASSNWCMECTFYCTGDASGTYRIMGANESAQGSEYFQMRIRLGQYQFYTENANTLTGTAAFNKWTHIAMTKSGTTVRAFVDGVKIWEVTDNNADTITTLITGWGYGSEYFPGFISNARFVNGSSVYTSEFNPPVVPLTNITNTTHLFCQSNTSATAAAVGTIAANGTAAASRFTPFNTDINTVRGQETGYATLNPLQMSLNSTPTMSNGNLSLSRSSGSSEWTNTGCTMNIPKSGKWFWEITWTSVGGGSVARCGVADSNDYEFNRNTSGTGLPWLGSGTGTSWSCDVRGYKYNGGTETTGYLSAFAAGDVMGILLDRDNNTITYTRNGLSGGVAHSNVTPDFVTPGFSLHAGTTNSFDVNFGQKPFKFPPPDGYQPLNIANTRPETVITRPDQYVGVKLFSMPNGGSGGTVTLDNDFDMVWTKNRTNNSTNHVLQDSVRGYGDNKNLHPNLNVQQTSTNNITAVNGRTLTIGSNTNYYDNNVAWSWKAGGSKGVFNVDDVGYANASDVNMSVGALNNIAFNKSQAWSSNASGGSGVANAFNGVGPKKDNYSHSGSALTLTFSPALTGRIVVYGGTGAGSHNSATTDTFTLSDGSVLSSQEKYDVFPYFTKMDFGEKSGITSLVCSAGYTLYGITLDGKLLVDSSVSIDAPTIANSKCSVGTKQGFSIINFTNTTSNSTHAHGLTQKPDFIVMKKTNGTSHWPVYHSSMGPKYGYLNLTNAFGIGSGEMWNYTEPNDHYVTLRGEANTFGSAGDVIMYCWHDVPGLQKFGSYTGNSNANGSYVELGFRPALLWLKRTDSTGNWVILDTKRNPSNPVTTSLYADTNEKDYAPGQNWADILSSGFKLRATYGEVNVGSYIYCAWAEAPAVNLYGGQSNAR